MKRNKISYAKLYINDSELTCRIRFSKKAKYLQLRITSSNQLELIIPKGYSIKDGHKFIRDKVDWIKKNQKNLIVPDKKEFLLFGEKINIEQSFNFFLTKYRIRLNKNILTVESPADSRITIEELFQIYVRKTAKEYFLERVKFFSDQFGFKYKAVKIRGQKTRWGSCSSNGSLSFNFKLLQFKKEIIDYVIIHELCHTKQMNHSQKFWKLVGQYCPDYKSLKKELKNSNLRN
ncbi:MAG: SprT family zinc-dependent metalloprotease [Ignavibacteriaceae bacterium]